LTDLLSRDLRRGLGGAGGRARAFCRGPMCRRRGITLRKPAVFESGAVAAVLWAYAVLRVRNAVRTKRTIMPQRSPRRQVSRLPPERRIADIMTAAREIFAEKGYTEHVISEIAE